MKYQTKTLGTVAEYINGRAFKPSEWENNGLPIIRIQNLTNPNAPFNYSSSEHEKKFVIKNGDLLFAWSASLGAHIWNGSDAWLNQHIFKVIPKNDVDKKFLYYYLSKVVSDLYSKAHGTGMVHITKKPFMNTSIPIPDIMSQRIIVKHIEESLSQLDNAVETLNKTKQQLEIYRQAVLKEAFSNNDIWKKHTLKDLALDFRNGYSKKPDDKGQYKILRISAIRAMSINLNDYRLNITPFNETDTIKPYDLLFTRYNGSAEYVGVCACVPDIKDCFAYPDKIIRCRLKEPDIYLAKFLEYYLNHGETRQYIRKHIKTTSGQNGIASSDIQKVTVLIPEKSTQKAIVKGIEERLSNCEMIEQIVNKSLQQAEALRQSILKQAFEEK